MYGYKHHLNLWASRQKVKEQLSFSSPHHGLGDWVLKKGRVFPPNSERFGEG